MVQSHALGVAGVLALLLMVSGCGGDAESNLSPTPDRDPQRYEQAKRQTEAMIRKNRQAERKFLRSTTAPEGP